MANFTLDGIATAAQQLVTPAPSSGQIGFATIAQDQNRAPGHSMAIPRPDEVGYAKTMIDPFWPMDEAIDANRWDKRYPYQILVLSVLPNGKYQRDPYWEYTLPIPPESMTISTPFAITTQVTLGGIVEEHNGAPLRMINLRGTTGVLPNRGTAAAETGVPDAQRFLGGAFAGTIQNFAGAVQEAAQVFGAVQFNLENETELAVGNPGFKGRGTGFFQFHLLERFLNLYVNLKKRPEGKLKRLAFANWKDQAIYIVTPVSFQLTRSANDPLAYQYDISLKAWRKLNSTDLGLGVSALENYRSRRQDPTFLKSVLNVISEARSILTNAKDALVSVRGDLDTLLFEPLRQTELLCKDALGLGASLADLPAQIASDSKASGITAAAGAGNKQALEAEPSVTFGSQNVKSPAGTSIPANSSAEPAVKTFSDPAANFTAMSKIDVRKLQLQPQTRRRIQDEIDRVRKLERADFELMRDNMVKVATDFAASVGAGSDTYSETLQRPEVTVIKTEPSDEDFEVMFALNNTITEMSKLALAGTSQSARLQAIEYVAGLATRSGIAFQKPVSKFSVPFPYGFTLEQLAATYLGDPNRFHEIVALNGLRAPYIDEEGFDLELLVNGSGNQIVVNDATNLTVGQLITLTSTNTQNSKRRVKKIDKVTDTMIFVTLDGEPDLSRFTTMAQAKLHAYLPDTVNSQMLIFIPSQTQVEDALTLKTIPGVNDYSSGLEVGGVDLLLTPSGDAAITPEGDWKLAVGLVNIIQRARIALSTPKGSLPQHRAFGLGLQPGVSTADLDAKQILASAKQLFADDPDFQGVAGVTVQKRGPTMSVGLNLSIAGQDKLLPNSVEIRR